MSRGIRDLRELISVSRLNFVEKPDEFQCFPDFKFNTFLTASGDEVKIKKTGKKVKVPKPTITPKSVLPQIKTTREIEVCLKLFDDQILTSWLAKANTQLMNMSEWTNSDNEYVNFCNFWLTDFPATKRRDLFKLEFDILLAEVTTFLMRKHYKDGSAIKILEIVFWEYPGHCLSSSGYYLFLDYLDILTTRQKQQYKTLLSAVTIDSVDKDVVQACLSLRAFCLISVWSAVIKFYRQLLNRGDATLFPVELHLTTGDATFKRICIAICHEFVEVLQYWLQKRKIDLCSFKDDQGRNLLILAVSYNSIHVLKYFIENYDVSSIINQTSEAGNTALHLAACKGNIELVRVLIESGNADFTIGNVNCENCTPYQMALTYEHHDVANYLFSKGSI